MGNGTSNGGGSHSNESGNSDVVRLGTRVARLEEWREASEKVQDEHGNYLKNIDQKVDKLSHWAAKTNGSIPRMAEDVAEVKEVCKTLADQQHEQALVAQKVTTKMALLWAGGGVIATAFIAALIKYVVFTGG